MSKQLWMIYDVKGLARNHSFVKMFEERGLPYDIQVKAVLDTEYESQLRQSEKPSAVFGIRNYAAYFIGYPRCDQR